MGIGIKNLGFGFILILIIKTLKGVLKQIQKELTSDNLLKHSDLMGLKGALFQNPLCALKNNFTTE